MFAIFNVMLIIWKSWEDGDIKRKLDSFPFSSLTAHFFN